MKRPDPIEYAETLYDAIAAANFSPISFLAFGNAIKDGVPFRNMPRMAAEPFMRVVGEMLDLEDESSARQEEVRDAEVCPTAAAATTSQSIASEAASEGVEVPSSSTPDVDSADVAADQTQPGRKRGQGKR